VCVAVCVAVLSLRLVGRRAPSGVAVCVAVWVAVCV